MEKIKQLIQASIDVKEQVLQNEELLKTVAAVANLRAVCSQHFEARHEIEIVDLLDQPARALADGVIVTPTLLKLSPLPAQRLIGSLSDTKHVLIALVGA